MNLGGHSRIGIPLLAAALAVATAGCFGLRRDPTELAVGAAPKPVSHLRSTAGKPVELEDLAPARRFPVLVFYRGHW